MSEIVSPHIAIHIALEEEYDAFISHLEKMISFQRLDIEDAFSNFAYNTKNKADGKPLTIHIAVLCRDKMGGMDAGQLVKDFLQKFTPQIFINLGLAGKLSDDISVGDVVIPDVLDCYSENSKVKDDKGALVFEFAGEPYRVPFWPLDQIRSGIVHKKPWYKKWQDRCARRFDPGTATIPDAINTTPKIKIGHVATGPLLGVSNKLKNSLKSGRDRKYLAMEMEVGAVISACQERQDPIPFLSFKVISDPASAAEKKALDGFEGGYIRAWGVQNLAELFQNFIDNEFSRFLKDAPAESNQKLKVASKKLHSTSVAGHATKNELPPQSSLDAIVKKYFLHPHYAALDLVNLQPYSEFFSLLLSEGNESPDFFEDLARDVLESEHSVYLNLVAQKGSGKSSFLAVLYRSLQILAEKGELVTPIYVHFRRAFRSIKKYSGAKDGESFRKKSLADCAQIFQEAFAELEGRKVVAIIDGFEDIARHEIFEREFANILLETISSHSNLVWIAGSRDRLQVGEIPDPFASYIDDSILNRIELGAVNKRNPKYEQLIRKFIAICNPGLNLEGRNRLFDRWKRFDAYNLDLFLMSIVTKKWGMANYEHVNGVARFIELYSDSLIQKQRTESGKTLPKKEVAESIFYGDFLKFDEKQLGTDRCRKIYDCLNNIPDGLRSHSLMRDYFVAYHGFRQILHFDANAPQLNEFKYVYYDAINYFYKALITSDNETEAKVLEQLIAIYDALVSQFCETHDESLRRESVRGMAHCTYLAGRLSFDRNRIIKFLESAKSTAEELQRKVEKSERKEFGLLIRGIYISLAYVGSLESSHDYIERLITDKTEDNLNRGFHLEYYGDQAYSALDGMNHEDKGGACRKTFSHLKRKITEAIEGAQSPLFYIEVHTLLSLVQHRHQAGAYDDLRKPSIELIGKLLSSNVLHNRNLINFCKFVAAALETDNYDAFHLVDDIYDLKKTLRTGWIGKLVAQGEAEPSIRIESVAEHTFGACLLAYYFIDDATEVNGEVIDKQKLILTLLLHDVAECYTGDKVGKTERDKEIEAAHIERMSFVGTNSDVPNHRDLAQLYSEIEERKTPEGALAKDLDLIENLIQLFRYKPQMTEEDFLTFRSNLTEGVQTDVGLHIMKKVYSYYEGSSGPN